MSDYFSSPTFSINSEEKKIKKKESYFIHALLFLITFITTTFAGMEWISTTPHYEIKDLAIALPYSLSILFVLGCHEFGHYFAARYHKVEATLPYFIPLPAILGFINFGTLGAVIKTKTPIPSKKALFDIGVAGPIAGFFASILILIYGLMTVPDVNYLLKIHPDYFEPIFGRSAIHLEFGSTLMFLILKDIFASNVLFFPPMSEIYHYPYLCVGWFGLFVTSMNLIPVGQLDGGHISYAMYGKEKHAKISAICLIVLFFMGISGLVFAIFNINFEFGWAGWLFWAFILYFVIKTKHPSVEFMEELDYKRQLIGNFALLILMLSFSPSPFMITIK